jgi:hypothetical protein
MALGSTQLLIERSSWNIPVKWWQAREAATPTTPLCPLSRRCGGFDFHCLMGLHGMLQGTAPPPILSNSDCISCARHNLETYYWISGLCPTSWIAKSRKHNVSETRSVSVLRRWEGSLSKGQTQSRESSRLSIAVSRIWSRVISCGICDWESDNGVRVLEVLRFPLPILILSTAPHSLSLIQAW